MSEAENTQRLQCNIDDGTRATIIHITINTDNNKLLVPLKDFTYKDNRTVVTYEQKLSYLLTCLYCEQGGDTEEVKLKNLSKDYRFIHVQDAIQDYTGHKIELIDIESANIVNSNIFLFNIINFTWEEAILNFVFCPGIQFEFRGDHITNKSDHIQLL